MTPSARLFPLLALLVAGCDTLPADSKTQGSGREAPRKAIAVGKNLVGEDCQATPVNDDPSLGYDRRLSIRCGTWTQPSGAVARLVGRRGDGAAITAMIERTPWFDTLTKRANCAAPVMSRGDGGQALAVLNCQLRIGGWPYVGLVSIIGDAVWVAEGVAPAVPALEAALAVQTGRAPAVEASATTRQVSGGLGGRRFGAGDMADYQALMERGAQFNLVNDYAQAELAFRDARATHEKLLPGDPSGIESLMSLAVQISNQGRFGEADRLFDAAIARAPKADPLAQARLLHYRVLHGLNFARSSGGQGDLKATDRLLDQADAAYRALLRGEDLSPEALRRASAQVAAQLTGEADIYPVRANALLGLIEVLRLRASLQVRMGEARTAETLAQSAVSLLDSVDFDAPATRPRLLWQRARAAMTRGDLAAAIGDLEKSVRLLEGLVPNTRPVANAQFTLGAALLSAGRTDEALSRFRAGDQVMAGNILGLAAPTVTPYLEALHNAAERAAPSDRARYFAEMLDATQIVKSGQTNSSILQAAARLAANDPRISAAIHELQVLDQELGTLNQRRDAEEGRDARFRSTEALARIDGQIREIQERRAAAEQAVQSSWAQYNQLVLTRSRAAAIPELLAPDEALWHVFIGPERAFGFFITRAGIDAYPIALSAAEIAEQVKDLRRAFAIDAKTRMPPDYDVKLAARLFGHLFGPHAAGLARFKTLTVVPSGPLLSLPFSLMVTGPGEVADGDYRKVPFLVRSVAVRHHPALASFVTLRRNVAASSAPNPYIGFGAFRPGSLAQAQRTFTGDACKADAQLAANLSPLQNSRAEIERVARILGAGAEATVFDTAFTRDRVTKGGLERYRILHFASHALLPSDLRCQPEPSLLFSTPPGAESMRESFFTASDVARLTLNADLVVLSACNSAGPGGSFAGESLTGLARSFFFAGARGVLATHWEVLDEQAARIMADFFTAQRDGDTASALRDAQLRYLDGLTDSPLDRLLSHPFAWAPFALIGDARR